LLVQACIQDREEKTQRTEKAGGRMKPELIALLRLRWKRLRIYRRPGTVLVDYRILRNFIRIYQVAGAVA